MAAAGTTSSGGAAAAGVSDSSALPPFPSESWTFYFHDPEEKSWNPSTLKVLGVVRSWTDLWSSLKTIDDDHFQTGMYFFMKDPYPPLWEAASNNKGGSYQIKVFETESRETYERYCAAAILKQVSTNPENLIKGISISLKKRHHIIKLWNHNAKAFNKPTDIHLLGDKMILPDVVYYPAIEKF
jgi:hypothetical protein